jgi:hypothetical protein
MMRALTTVRVCSRRSGALVDVDAWSEMHEIREEAAFLFTRVTTVMA